MLYQNSHSARQYRLLGRILHAITLLKFYSETLYITL